ncbi:MAG: SPOR domain-containing protein [Gemmobacter sp.]|nr:SPOR domain-containing protein [Gemmobacter sp.]
MGRHKAIALMLITTATFTLAGCEGGMPFGKGTDGDDTETTSALAPTSTRIVERDTEAPEVFSAAEPGLWDGRPSLGGVWVAYPGVTDPERVIIRNPANGKFVIGALFRRERENPGPKLQVSSDTAAALDMLAGQPTQITVTALRREEAPEVVAGPINPILDTAETISTETLDPVAGAANPVLDNTDAARPTTDAAPTAATRPAAKPAPKSPPKPAAPTPAATGGRNLLQLGIFSVEANANKAADQLRKAGAGAAIKKETSQGKTFWRVLAGPAKDAADRDALLAKVKGLGYADAYYVSR